MTDVSPDERAPGAPAHPSTMTPAGPGYTSGGRPTVPTPVGATTTAQRKSGWGKAGGVAAGGAAIAAKLGGLAKLGAAVKFLALGAKFQSLLSMFMVIWFYALFWGWPFAVGFVLLIAIHELGHAAVMRSQGLQVSALMFLPMVAWTSARGRQQTVAERAWSALAGPLAGLAGSVLFFYASQVFGSQLLQALAYTGFLMNLFNLIPIAMLDGGRVAGALHPGLWISGGILGLGLAWRYESMLWLVLAAIGAWMSWRAYSTYRQGDAREYDEVTSQDRWRIGVAYVMVAVACAVGMQYAHVVPPTGV